MRDRAERRKYRILNIKKRVKQALNKGIDILTKRDRGILDKESAVHHRVENKKEVSDNLDRCPKCGSLNVKEIKSGFGLVWVCVDCQEEFDFID